MGKALVRKLALAGVLGVLLLGCEGAERERRAETERQRLAAAERERQVGALVSRCRNQQKTVQLQLQTLKDSNAELARLSQQRYVPLKRPVAPDPALLARFTRDDQMLQLERHTEAMVSWRQADGAAQRRWELQQQGRRQALTARQQLASAELTKLGVATTAEAQTAWSSCDGMQLAALALR